ncbi:rRNA maturation RNase YbeY [Agaribacterium sp. ZY112]|uniref:rRNA maturation RNase YbeY n=1 Tax=Agaribacterium sp. ZY112 TaxID=3233574 RepID=UPI003525EE70
MANIDVQIACAADALPSEDQLQHWCKTALKAAGRDGALALRISDAKEIQTLNQQYRNKNNSTNVLSFPSDLPAELGLDELGDIIMCAEVIAREAVEQNKNADDHWAHMVIHGTLHLCGYDHIDDKEAEEMEALETQILATLGINNPYLA